MSWRTGVVVKQIQSNQSQGLLHKIGLLSVDPGKQFSDGHKPEWPVLIFGTDSLTIKVDMPKLIFFKGSVKRKIALQLNKIT